jgi:uncharacterized protein (DUF1810 family)
VTTEDRFDLQRFVEAQRDVYAAVVEELRRGLRSSLRAGRQDMRD